MSDELIGIIVIILACVLVGAVVYKLFKVIEGKKLGNFQKIANQYSSLRLEKDKQGKYGAKRGPILLGILEEKEFVGYTYVTGAGKHSVHWTAFKLKHGLNLEGYELKLVNEHFLRKIGKRLGTVNEVELGVQEFDQRFLIQSNNLSTSRNLLNKQTRDKMLSIPKMYFGEIVITNTELSYKLPYQLVNDKIYTEFEKSLDIGLLLLRALKRIYD
ncbi:hypothetical protein [Aureispira anguillae]|uniref:Uncharacterized protein n=1 Tax=Aureispira anguillae TaxID=2864201 RepID=A0A915YFU5_9BACT|nr:hypothetical protein [Aureispira anguillae]BDS12244.1 hypothetical protein AsAng_0029630 [Aureispira anguillae]